MPTRRRSIVKLSTNLPADAAAALLPPTGMPTGSTAPIPATSKAAMGGVPVTNEQFNAEKDYQAARQIAESFRKQGLLTEEEFAEIDTILLQKFRPYLGTLFAENACYSKPSE